MVDKQNDKISLPEAPAPSENIRAHAIYKAMRMFDAKHGYQPHHEETSGETYSAQPGSGATTDGAKGTSVDDSTDDLPFTSEDLIGADPQLSRANRRNSPFPPQKDKNNPGFNQGSWFHLRLRNRGEPHVSLPDFGRRRFFMRYKKIAASISLLGLVGLGGMLLFQPTTSPQDVVHASLATPLPLPPSQFATNTKRPQPIVVADATQLQNKGQLNSVQTESEKQPVSSTTNTRTADRDEKEASAPQQTAPQPVVVAEALPQDERSSRLNENIDSNVTEFGEARLRIQRDFSESKQAGSGSVAQGADTSVSSTVVHEQEPVQYENKDVTDHKDVPDNELNQSTTAPVVRDQHAKMAPSKPVTSPTRVRVPQHNNLMVAPEPVPQQEEYEHQDAFKKFESNAVKQVKEEPVSTFSLDVDTASYSFARASILAQNRLPRADAVRVEEFINYFPYNYPLPTNAEEPFRTTVSVFPSPWSAQHKVMHIGVKGYEVKPEERPRANIVFLIDTSGSMSSANRLPLAKQALVMLVDTLAPEDTVSIVTYAGRSGIALEPTLIREKAKIMRIINGLQARGSTAGAEGLQTAYALAEQNFDKNGVNRIILASDGDFNVGMTNLEEMKSFISRKREQGIFLSALGFGMGNYKDTMMQTLAQNGNGVAAYIDTLSEARKVLVQEATSSIIPIANDVKIQVEFNPETVQSYRLVGYEKRLLRREDFNNDKVDAGDIGSGHTVTALYEFLPKNSEPSFDNLRYQQSAKEEAQKTKPTEGPASAYAYEYALVKMRYKLPKSDSSVLQEMVVDKRKDFATLAEAPQDVRFALAVASFAEHLRGGQYSGSMTLDDIIQLAQDAKGDDPFGYRTEFIQLVRAAKTARKI